jgi:GTP cyclohydrolase I
VSRDPIQAVISLGSNIERERYLPEAIRHLRRHRGITVQRVSGLFESAPVGGPEDAPPFFNAAAVIATEFDPPQLRAELRRIEAELGRERTGEENAPRTIDLDIAYYGDQVEDFGDWRIPDPHASTTPYVAVPIADVAPDWVDPVTGATARDLADRLESGRGSVWEVKGVHLSSPYELRVPQDFDEIAADVYAPQLEALVRQQLVEIGENPDREGLLRTPLRVAKALDFLTSGYSQTLADVVNDAIFDAEGVEEMVLVKGIEFYSMCEHHMLPFFGKAAVAYLPKGSIIGLSKVARIVDLYARRLQVQERLTNQIAHAVDSVLEPHGVAVVMEGRHLCMMMRGVQKQDSSMVTSAMLGTFKTDARTRNELLDLVGR